MSNGAATLAYIEKIEMTRAFLRLPRMRFHTKYNVEKILLFKSSPAINSRRTSIPSIQTIPVKDIINEGAVELLIVIDLNSKTAFHPESEYGNA